MFDVNYHLKPAIFIERRMDSSGTPPVLPRASDTLSILSPWQPTGRCFHCLEHLEAIQPGGKRPRHVADKIPYGECLAAKERKLAKTIIQLLL